MSVWVRDIPRERRADSFTAINRLRLDLNDAWPGGYSSTGILDSHPCVACGEADGLVLEFDHVAKKRASVSSLTAEGWSIKRLRREVELCDVVCVNCHRRRTYRRGISWRNDPRTLDETLGLLPNERRNLVYLRTLLQSVDCAIRDLRVLEFDHVGPKRGNVFQLARRGCSFEVLEDELSQCEIRCANCHRRRTELVRRDTARASVS